MRWRFWRSQKKAGPKAVSYSISDPNLAYVLGIGNQSYAGVSVSEDSALGLSAVWRAVNIVAGTVAGLPLRTLRDTGDGMRQRIASIMDDPGAVVGLTPFSWTEMIVAHLLLHGDAFLRHIYGGASQLVGLVPIHPGCVSVEWADRPGGKLFKVRLVDGATVELDSTGMTQIMGLSLDGLRGMSVIAMARNGFGTAIAGDRAAAKMFGSGALMSGILVPEEDVDDEEVRAIREKVDSTLSGWENAGSIPLLNRKLKFVQWSMNAVDAQFLESRQFSIREIARWFGIPPHLLMETSAASNWGTGIEQQNLGLARFNLAGWTCRIEQALSRLLPRPRFVEFDFAGLERPSPETEIRLLIDQVTAGLLTLNEARAIRNLPPVDTGPTPAEQAVEEGAPA